MQIIVPHSVEDTTEEQNWLNSYSTTYNMNAIRIGTSVINKLAVGNSIDFFFVFLPFFNILTFYNYSRHQVIKKEVYSFVRDYAPQTKL